MLLEYEIRYTPEAYRPGRAEQVRPPVEILDSPGEGTSLDLSLLFCGICIGWKLIPCLVRVQGHAFAMISLGHRLHDPRVRPEWEGLRDEPLEDATSLKKWIDGGDYLAVECSGFAIGQDLEPGPEAERRGPDGLLAFADARQAGRAQLDVPSRPLEFAIDLSVARNDWKVESDRLRQRRRPGPQMTASTLPARPGASKPTLEHVKCLIDRVPQKDVVLSSLEKADSLSRRPSVFFMEGELEQATRMLVLRLVTFDVPDWLKTRAQMSDQGLFHTQLSVPSRRRPTSTTPCAGT